MGRAWVLPSYTGTSSRGASGAVALQILAQQWSFVHALHRAAASDGFVMDLLQQGGGSLPFSQQEQPAMSKRPLHYKHKGILKFGADMPACNPPETTPEFTPLHRLGSAFNVVAKCSPACRRPPARRGRCRSLRHQTSRRSLQGRATPPRSTSPRVASRRRSGPRPRRRAESEQSSGLHL